MKRREFITLLGSAAATWPLAARAQQGAMGDRVPSPRIVQCFCGSLACLKDAGFIEGKNAAIEYRWAEIKSIGCLRWRLTLSAAAWP
jgi:hypothetical protein